ncbi:hypothetical protein Tbis_3178 [Thermobispora bispora DSM 43833]|uniref:Uncharacterized protein n=1 Tax=Thermobispora bispora (strain ATCC 19993 / DSM 43833 / CBS 139.67 / JCM 10125 / KCTC 9307 / NBRC 14880 / R51) TaxID=469371 RepID=D6Y8D6_THEBD|nr:hypothetical protein Tbis_3178 [Thermobispora bispora DSM 43833]
MLRQYWTIITVRHLTNVSTPSRPLDGSAYSSLSIGAISLATGNHVRTARSLLIRIPIRKTTKSPSILALCRMPPPLGSSTIQQLDSKAI